MANKRKVRTVKGELQPKKPTSRQQMAQQLASQHPIHSAFGTAFEAVGGVERLTEWAEDNYDKFIMLFSKMAPAPDGKGGGGRIQIQINNKLGPSPLDE